MTLRLALLLAVLTAITAPGRAQEVRVLGPDPAEVLLGERARLVIVVDDATAALGPLSAPRDLGLRPATVQEIDGGRRWVIEVEPRRAGRLEIPSLSVLIGEVTRRTEPLTLRARVDETAAAGIAVRTEVPERVWEGQEFTLRLVIDVDSAFLRDAVLQPFRVPLSVPLRIDAPWLDALPATAPARIAGAEPGDVETTLVLNGREVRGRRVGARAAGRDLVIIDRRILAVKAGRLSLDDGLVRLAYATRFEEDFIRGRIPRDRRPAALGVPGRDIEIAPLPEKGRPPGFSGAVGSFRVEAALVGPVPAEPLSPGDQVRIRLRVVGPGTIARPPLPADDAVPGFRALGIVADARRSATDRDFLLDLEAVSGVDEIASLPWPHFDPVVGAYRVARSESLPVAVRGPSATARQTPSARGPADGLPDIVPFDATRHRAERSRVGSPGPGPGTAVRVLAASLALLTVLNLLRIALRRRSLPEMRARRSFAATRRGNSDAVATWIGLRLGTSATVVHDADLAERLVRAGAPAAEVTSFVRELRARQARRFEAPSEDPSTAEVSSPLRLEAIESALRGVRPPWTGSERLSTLLLAGGTLVLVSLFGLRPLVASIQESWSGSAPTWGWEDPTAAKDDALAAPASAVDAAGQDPAREALVFWAEGDRRYREGRFAEALLAYRRAAARRRADRDLARNVHLAAAALGRTERGPRGFAALGQALLDVLAGWWGLAIAGLAVFVGAAGLVLAGRRRLAILGTLLAVGLLVAVHVEYRARALPGALVVSPELALRAGPDPRGAVRRKLVAGTDLGVLEGDARWLRVRLPDGEEGWVEASGIGRIDFPGG